MPDSFASVDDLIRRWRSLSIDEISLAETLLIDCSNALRVYAMDRGYNLDNMLGNYKPRRELAKAITCDIVKREMCSINDNTPAMSQFSQAAGGYSVSGTYLSPGGGLFIKNSELKMLGLMRQRVQMRGGDTDGKCCI